WSDILDAGNVLRSDEPEPGGEERTRKENDGGDETELGAATRSGVYDDTLGVHALAFGWFAKGFCQHQEQAAEADDQHGGKSIKDVHLSPSCSAASPAGASGASATAPSSTSGCGGVG